jgi:hypothetical protein
VLIFNIMCVCVMETRNPRDFRDACSLLSVYCELYAIEYKPKTNNLLPSFEAEKLWEFPESAMVWR